MGNVFMQPVFQAPLQLKSVPDQDFWDQIQKLDELSELFDHTPNGFSITINSGEQKTSIPFIRFRKNISSVKS